MNKRPKNDYQLRINAVIKHIYAELATPTENGLTLDKLSQVACFSKYHFHRIFVAMTGLSLHQFVRRLQLKKATYQLAFSPELKIIEIAFDAGFENHESFSRAFKKTYQLTPSQFRKKPDWLGWSEKHDYQISTTQAIMETTICHFPTTLIAVLEHHGDFKLVNQSVAAFINWRKSSDESPIVYSDTFGLAYADPDATPVDEYQFDICASIIAPVKPNPFGVITKTIPGGQCVRITHLGSHDMMGDKIRYLYNQWVLQNNAELRDFPCFFHYRNLFPQVAEHELITDIYLPIV